MKICTTPFVCFSDYASPDESYDRLLSFSDWEENPAITTIESVTSPIEDLMFPTVTLCPKNPNPDRWGATIKLFDYMRQGCDSKE